MMKTKVRRRAERPYLTLAASCFWEGTSSKAAYPTSTQGGKSLPPRLLGIPSGKCCRRGVFILLLSDRPDSLYKAEDFSTFSSSGDVLLDVCAADSPAQLMRERGAKKVC